MTPYLITFSLFLVAFFAFETICKRRSPSSAELLILVFPLAVFALTFAGRIGTDVEQYAHLFEMAEDFPLEPGFSLLMIGAKRIGLDYVEFTTILALIQMMLLVSVVTRLREPQFFLLFYLSSFFLNFQFNAIRNSLALLIVAAIYVRVQRPSLLALLSSTVIHYSSPLTIGLQKLAASKHWLVAISAVAMVAGLFSALWLRPDFIGDGLGDLFVYKGYLEQEYESKSIYPALLMKLMVIWLLFRNGGGRFYLITYAILVVLVHLISPVLSRLCDLVLFLALLDFCTRLRLQRHRTLTIALTLILVLSSLLIPWNDCLTGGEDRWCIAG